MLGSFYALVPAGGAVTVTKSFFQTECWVRRILRTKESLLEETERAKEGQREPAS